MYAVPMTPLGFTRTAIWPPGVGSAHTSSSRKSGVSSWMRHGREVCAASGSLIGRPSSVRMRRQFAATGPLQLLDSWIDIYTPPYRYGTVYIRCVNVDIL